MKRANINTSDSPPASPISSPTLVEGEDYYMERGMIVFTARYHLKRGNCCGSGCRHCPFDETKGARRETKDDNNRVVREPIVP